MAKNNIILFIIAPLLLIFSCDQFSRFNHESYKCGSNLFGIDEIILGKVKKGAIVKLIDNNTVIQNKIYNIFDNKVSFFFNNKDISVHRLTGNLYVKENNKLTIIECEISKFKM